MSHPHRLLLALALFALSIILILNVQDVNGSPLLSGDQPSSDALVHDAQIDLSETPFSGEMYKLDSEKSDDGSNGILDSEVQHDQGDIDSLEPEAFYSMDASNSTTLKRRALMLQPPPRSTRRPSKAWGWKLGLYGKVPNIVDRQWNNVRMKRWTECVPVGCRWMPC